MPPIVASVFCAVGILALCLFEREQKIRISKALWIPVIWASLAVSKPVSQWLQSPGTTRLVSDQLEGNPVERAVFTVLVALGLLVLAGRGRKVLALLQMNGPILIFICYCALSTLWSDYPDVAFKRWIKVLGDCVIVMIVLTDPNRSYAVKRFLAWTGFLLIPISILLIRYYPVWGRGYKIGTGREVFTGVTNDKNTLGAICLVFGIAAVWRILHGLRERPRRKPALIANGTILAMACWLFAIADSLTSLVCFSLASILLLAISFPALARNRTAAHFVVAALVSIALVALFFDTGGGMVKTLGRDPSLTGRTEIWAEVISLVDNPVLGTGFESFWLGRRLEEMWSRHWWHPNEAHNGYLEVYLNLGWAGITLLGIVMLTAYRNAIRMMRSDPQAAALRLAYFMVAIIYSFTEAGFRMMHPVWICFVLSAFAVPRSPAPTTPRGIDTTSNNPPTDQPTPAFAYKAPRRLTSTWHHQLL